MNVCVSRAGRRLLSLDQVVAAGRPATFACYGDHLAYVDETIYSLPREPQAHDLRRPLAVPGAYVVSGSAGVEFGWRHLDDCDCPLCAVAADREAAAAAVAAVVSTG